MHAAVVDGAGAPETFRIIEMPVPVPRDLEIVVRQKYAAVNYGDVTRRKRGLFPADVSPPYVLGFEGVGTVEAVGDAVTDFHTGDRVAYLMERGGYAEFIAVPAMQAWAVPPAIDDEVVAGITCVGLTSWGLMEASGVQPAETALVHGAAGGVGSILIQALASQGTHTIALVTGEQKKEFVTQLGAQVVLDRVDTDVADRVRTLCPGGVDAVFDCVGREALALNLATIKAGATWMYFGSTSGHPDFPGDKVLMNRLSIQGFVVFDFVRESDQWKRGTAFLAASLTRGTIIPQTTMIVPLDQVSEAHRMLESRNAMGKILLSF